MDWDIGPHNPPLKPDSSFGRLLPAFVTPCYLPTSPFAPSPAAVVEREPVLTGKPAAFLLQEIMSSHGVSPQEMLMVGDRLDTDILWGQSTGMDTCLVLTGRDSRWGEVVRCGLTRFGLCP
jgi:hypothetical protein